MWAGGSVTSAFQLQDRMAVAYIGLLLLPLPPSPVAMLCLCHLYVLLPRGFFPPDLTLPYLKDSLGGAFFLPPLPNVSYFLISILPLD